MRNSGSSYVIRLALGYWAAYPEEMALSALLSASEEPLKDPVIFAGRVTGAAPGGL